MLLLEHKILVVLMAVILVVGCSEDRPKDMDAAAINNIVINNLNKTRMPKPVFDVVSESFRDASIIHAWRDTVDGKPVFEVTLRRDGKCFDVSVTSKGQLLEVEMPISERELPPAVAAVVAARYPDFRIVEAEEVRPVHGGSIFELSLAANKVSAKSRYDRDGRLISEIIMRDSK